LRPFFDTAAEVKTTVIEALKEYLTKAGKVAIAYSGGVDSTFLLAMSAEVLGAENVLALTVQSPLMPPWEVAFAKEFCHARGITHRLLDGSFVLDDERIAANPSQRCYYCKRKILEAIQGAIADDYTLHTGTNASDETEVRPGMRAEEEMEVRTPLRVLRFTKDAIRAYSQTYGVPDFGRPSSPCFATRIPFGEPITVQKIRMIEKAETVLRRLGFALVRVRLIFGDTACIEVAAKEIARVCALHEEIARHLVALGFKRVTVDLKGYRMGNLNPVATNTVKMIGKKTKAGVL
jgi:uncharacterized protein